jgi:hypothetical protein
VRGVIVCSYILACVFAGVLVCFFLPVKLAFAVIDPQVISSNI